MMVLSGQVPGCFEHSNEPCGSAILSAIQEGFRSMELITYVCATVFCRMSCQLTEVLHACLGGSKIASGSGN